jgi:hypothetical protein
MRDFTYFDQVTDLLQSLARQAQDAVARGLSLEDARKAIDLTRYHDRFVQGKEEREGTFQASILKSGIESAYDEAKGSTGSPPA